MKSNHLGRGVLAIALSLLVSAPRADHGRDFLLVQTARLGDAHSVIGIARQDYTRANGKGTLALEPLLSWTATDWLSLEINGDAEREQGEQVKYEATVPGLRLRFTPKGNPMELGLAARYDISREDGADAFKLSALGSYEAGGWLFGGNLNVEKPQHERREWGYALGIKRELRHHLGVGLEIAGSFEAENSGEAILGVYAELTHDLQVNVGVGTGFNHGGDLTVKTAVIWRFR